MAEPVPTPQKSSGYARIVRLEEAFETIHTELSGLIEHKGYTNERDMLSGFQQDAKLARHKLLGMLGEKMSAFELKLADKLANSRS